MSRPFNPKRYPLNRNSSSGDEYATPQSLFDHYDRLFHFYLDVAATRENTKVRRYFNKEADGLKQSWTGPCWMNPPYSGIAPWLRKAHEESLRGATVVGLLPCRTGDSWFHRWVRPFADITFLNHRIRFIGLQAQGFQATFPSVIAVWPASAAIKSPSATDLLVHFDL